MPSILTRETIAEAQEANISGDQSESISLGIARGNVAVINEVQLEVGLRVVANTGTVEGAIGITLDAGLGAPGDLSSIATGSDDDIENDAAVLERMFYTFSVNADTTNGVGAATQGRAGKTINYRRLALMQRPMTSEDPELLANVTNASGNGINAQLTLYYQVVRLSDAEVQQLAPSILAPSARVVRFADVPQNGGFNGPEIRIF